MNRRMAPLFAAFVVLAAACSSGSGSSAGTSAGTGWYITPEAQTVRDVYRELEQEFGTVDVFVDLHNQGPCYTGELPSGEGTGEYSTLSISGRFIAEPTEFGDWPKFDYDAQWRVMQYLYEPMTSSKFRYERGYTARMFELMPKTSPKMPARTIEIAAAFSVPQMPGRRYSCHTSAVRNGDQRSFSSWPASPILPITR